MQYEIRYQISGFKIKSKKTSKRLNQSGRADAATLRSSNAVARYT